MKDFELKHGNSESKLIFNKSQELVICHRTQTYNNRRQIETYGPNWNIILAPRGRVRLRDGDQWIELNNGFSIFIPPFAVTEWDVDPGASEWISVMGLDDQLPIPNQILLLRVFIDIPLDKTDLIQKLNLFRTQGKIIKEEIIQSAISSRFKKLLIENYSDSFTIQDLCLRAKIHRRVVYRAFKQSYGLSPIEYRHRIRIFTVLRWMSKGYKIIDSVTLAGIKDSKPFLIHFRRFMGITPKVIKTKGQFELTM